MIKVFNTLTKKKEELKARDGKKLNMFVCGPTAYDYIHIGNARTFVFFDVAAKFIRHQGFKLDYIQNITDIDDKIIQRAKENKKSPLDWAKDYTEKFKEDMKSLGVTTPKYEPATKHIKEVVKQVKTLINKKYAYLIEKEGYYFDIKKFSNYGKLSGRTAQMADDAVSRIDESDKKRNAGDFVIWKFSKENEPSWDTDIGSGRPGWHIEDTAITEHYFGPQYDLHGGGQDLIFPHHEAEISLQESASGKKPFVKHWMHVAFVINKSEKMSKSTGNFTTAHELIRKYPKEAIRFYLLSNHYRSPLNYSDKIIRQSLAGVSRIEEFSRKLDKVSGKDDSNIDDFIGNAQKKFINAMSDDFNTPEAIASLFDLIRKLNHLITSNSISKKTAKKVKEFLNIVDEILGIIPKSSQKILSEVTKLVQEREKLRGDKKWDKSDRIRDKINQKGYQIEDTVYGPLVTRKK